LKRRDIFILILYVILTVALTWPMIGNMNDALAGSSSDVYMNPWADWWTKKVLTEGLDLYQTDYLFYPDGVNLVFHSFSHANTAISLLLTPLVGHFAAYNVTILLAYILSGFGMYLLISHLTNCRPAAFVAGYVFAFHPYHMFESAHPVIVTTQWIPLFALALIRLLHDTTASRVKQMLLAALWFALTALSSWHLMIMLAGWTALYLAYHFVFERAKWVPGSFRYLILVAGIVGLVVTPFLWPIVWEQLTGDTAYMAVEVNDGLGNDVLSFLIPNRRHPVFASLVSDINERIGQIRKRPAYLGYTSLGLAFAGVISVRRKARFWWLTGLLFLFLSLGLQIMFNGSPLFSFQLPWANPIINVLRHPFRLNILTFFSLSVLVGFGMHWLYKRVAAQRWLARAGLICVMGVILFEYLVVPFPFTVPVHSPFIDQLAQEEGDFAVADFPTSRKWAKYHMFYQMIHGRKMTDGHISRTPYDAYDFVDASPLLGPLHAQTAPDPDLDIEAEFAALAARGIRYIIIHKRLMESGKREDWLKWLSRFPDPVYEDNLIIVYRTTPDGAP
jgi:hypothetical protein